MKPTPETKMPFGQYKGEPISECPTAYLDWLIGQDWFKEKFPQLESEVMAHLRRQSDWQAPDADTE